MDSFPVTDPVE
jgi:hypothetical protein